MARLKKASFYIHRTYVLLFLLFMVLPIIIVVPSAFNSEPALAFPPAGFSMQWFEIAFTKPEFLDSFLISLRVAVMSTAIAVGCGIPAALAVTRYRFTGRDALIGIFLVPLIFPSIVLAVGLAMVLTNLGLIRTITGLVIAHSVLTFPYILRTAIASLTVTGKSFEEAAMTLGASPRKTFQYMTLPLLMPGLIAGITFAFIISFDEFTVSLFLVGPGVTTLPLALYNYTEMNFDPTIAAVSVVLLLMSAVAIVVIEKTVGLGRHLEV